MTSSIDLTKPGGFVVGCNYWASHAGTHMWRDWQPDVVEWDLARLAEAGLQVLRVFPLWPDFQPITQLYGGGGYRKEIRHGELPLTDDPCGQAGMSAEAMAHFADFLDMLDKHNQCCIVGLITGWMSGRLFVPPAIEGLNVLTDPIAIKWELRFIRHFVTTFRVHPAIAGWDLGNECNCMAAATQDQAYAWTATISNAIKAIDQTRPVISGMHGLSPEGTWTIQDQGELTDILTTHSYPVFTPHCDQDPVNTIRTISHSTAESRFYSDIGCKPCLCQEIGTLGPMIASESVAADFARSCLFSLWANDCHGMLWWCANDQTNLAHAPYDWKAVERELGLLCTDGSPKPVIEEMGKFRRFIASLPFSALPKRTSEAVCILTRGQDQWGAAYSSFILAKQAGFDIEFLYSSQPIKDAQLYLLPSLSGGEMISRTRLNELLAKVESGAALYISLDDGMPSDLQSITGLEPQTRERRRDFGTIKIDGIDGCFEIPCAGSFKTRFNPTRAQVLATETDGNPAFTVANYGKGKVYFISVPLEKILTQTPGAFHLEDSPDCWRVYQYISREAVNNRVVRKIHPMIALTEHPVSNDHRLIVAINQSPNDISDIFTLSSGWRLANVFYGKADAESSEVKVELSKNDAAVFSAEH
ncbi:MAG: beta-galactosidase trimerization domain-containing protein [Armatimonadota bacterium]